MENRKPQFSYRIGRGCQICSGSFPLRCASFGALFCPSPIPTPDTFPRCGFSSDVHSGVPLCTLMDLQQETKTLVIAKRKLCAQLDTLGQTARNRHPDAKNRYVPIASANCANNSRNCSSSSSLHCFIGTLPTDFFPAL